MTQTETATFVNHVKLDRAALSVARLAHPERTRPYAMQGVHVDEHGVTATNGKALAHVAHGTSLRVSCQSPDGLTLTAKSVADARKHATSALKSVILNTEYLDCTAITETPPKKASKRKGTPAQPGKTDSKPMGTATLAQGNFPPYRDVMPDYTSGYAKPLGGLDSLTPLATAANMLAAVGCDAMRLNYSPPVCLDSTLHATVTNGKQSGDALTVSRVSMDLGLGDLQDLPSYALALFNPSLVLDVIATVSTFVRGCDYAPTTVRCFLPDREQSKGDTIATEKPLVITAERADGRKLTTLLMPLADFT